jgi:aspartyl-tRNA(Asn)/glutamyl-tRNA(Gln) amidotransferase subunit A
VGSGARSMIAPTLSSLAADLDAGRVTARSLVEDCLQKIAEPGGEGSATFIEIDGKTALATADKIDQLRRREATPSALAGIPVSIKDLFDIEGQVTRAGSTVLQECGPSRIDATSVARLRRAGLIFIGRTNMTEFAYSGLGINPHFGTPKCVYRRDIGYVPGGSSSGAAISVSDGMAHAALGSDTGGSCRIPAAYNGLVGFKPTQSRVPRDGMIPLSFSFDSVGCIGRTVDCCRRIDALVAEELYREHQVPALRDVRLVVPKNVVRDDLDAVVSRHFDNALATLSKAGAKIVEQHISGLDEIAPLLKNGGFTASESYYWHRELLKRGGEKYDPQVHWRIMRGEKMTAADYIELVRGRFLLTKQITMCLSGYDALLAPTTAIAAPAIADVQNDPGFTNSNLLTLRNCTLINFIDGCAITLPGTASNHPPLGIMLAASSGSDHRLFQVAEAAERALAH